MSETTVHDIIARATRWTGYTRAQIVGPGRPRQLSYVRFAVTWAIRHTHPGLSLNAIGRITGRADHSVISYSLARAEERRQSNPAFCTLCDLLLGKELPGQMDWQEVQPWRDRPGRTVPACASLVEDIPLHDVAPAKWTDRGVLQLIRQGGRPGDPHLPAEEIARRARDTAARRRAHERTLIDLEQTRYGLTRQTMTRPLSEMVA